MLNVIQLRSCCGPTLTKRWSCSPLLAIAYPMTAPTTPNAAAPLAAFPHAVRPSNALGGSSRDASPMTAPPEAPMEKTDGSSFETRIPPPAPTRPRRPHRAARPASLTPEPRTPHLYGSFYCWPNTSTGELRSVVEPLPSWPAKLPPQQYASPPIVRPQVWMNWVLSDWRVSPPDTASGVVW